MLQSEIAVGYNAHGKDRQAELTFHQLTALSPATRTGSQHQSRTPTAPPRIRPHRAARFRWMTPASYLTGAADAPAARAAAVRELSLSPRRAVGAVGSRGI